MSLLVAGVVAVAPASAQRGAVEDTAPAANADSAAIGPAWRTAARMTLDTLWMLAGDDSTLHRWLDTLVALLQRPDTLMFRGIVVSYHWSPRACPMPVYVPIPGLVTPMPTAKPDTEATVPMPTDPIGCTNPLHRPRSRR